MEQGLDLSPRSVLLDTDLDCDCDDAGALCVLHALANAGECDWLGVICSVPIPACVGAVRAMNAACGRPELSVGAVREPDFDRDPNWAPYREHRQWLADGKEPYRLYNDRLAASWPGRHDAEDAVQLYRRTLAGAGDGAITICAIGTLTVLAQLLDSPPDGASPLPGRELVRRKVRELVSMAEATYPAGIEAFNWKMDRPAAFRVLSEWPTPIAVSPYGGRIRTGARFCRSVPPDHPVRLAYETYLGDPERTRASWDQVAALYAVRGAERAPFRTSEPLGLRFDPATAAYEWSAPGPLVRCYVEPNLPDDAMAELIEDLMIAGALRRR